MNKEVNHTKVLLRITIPAFCLMIILIGLQWYNIQKNITQTKDQNQKNFEKIYAIKDRGPINIDYIRLNKKQVVIDPKEIEKINNHIRALTEEVYKESNRAESIIDKDLDRLNLYMAVGIGFMTLLGVFVPILINVLSVQDLRDKQKDIESKTNEVLDKSKKLDEFSEKMGSVESKIGIVTLGLCNLNLQNAIARFFNISSIVLTNAVRKKNYQSFVDLLEAIKNAFEGCKGDTHHIITDNALFKNTVDDFILFLETEKFRYQSIFTKTEVKEFDNLIRHLAALKDSTKDNETKNYKDLDNQINVIINIFKGKQTT
jgi:hypothetical protein